MKESKNPTVGTLASIGDIRIRITAKSESHEEADRLIQEMEKEIRNRLGSIIYGVDDETLQGNIIQSLGKKNLTLSIVEVFTGGVISQKLGGTGGSSFIQGVILPSETSKKRFLNVSDEEFEALQNEPQKLTDTLAKKAKSDLGTDLALATYGKISEEQTRGEFRFQTYSSLATPTGIENQEQTIGGEPLIVRERASIITLDLLRKALLKVDSK